MHPRTDGTGMFMPCIPTSNGIAVTGSPDNIGIGQVGNRETGFAAAHTSIPVALSIRLRNTRPAHVSVVLHVAVEVIRNLLVDIHVVHLPDGKCDAMETASMDGGDVHASIVGDDEAVGIGGINPDVMRVAAPVNFLKI